MIIHVCSETLMGMWDKITPGLQRPLENTTLGEFWDLESLWEYIADGRLYGFYQPESGYSGVYAIYDTPKARQLTFFWSGKDPQIHQRVDYAEVDEHLKELASIFGCTHISCEGRHGWKKILEPLGYSVDGSFYIKGCQGGPK